MSQDKQTVLVVDDSPENIDVLVGILKQDYHIKAVINGEMALKIVRSQSPDIILLDIMMPGLDGYEVCQRLKEDYTTKHIPIIFITAKITADDELKGLRLGAVDYITKPINPPIVKARIQTHLALYDQNRELDRKVRLNTQQLHETRLQIIQRLGRAVEFKDYETGLHVIRMSHYSQILGLAAGMSETEAELLLNTAPMHDIGKIGVPDFILQKPGPLSHSEYSIIKQHCQIGADIIGNDDSELLREARIIALTHHEKWDGTGYPNELKGEKIPRIGRIVSIADVFDSLTTKRPYKRAWEIDDAIDQIASSAGTHFDPQLVQLFIENLDKIIKVKKRYPEQ